MGLPLATWGDGLVVLPLSLIVVPVPSPRSESEINIAEKFLASALKMEAASATPEPDVKREPETNDATLEPQLDCVTNHAKLEPQLDCVEPTASTASVGESF